MFWNCAGLRLQQQMFRVGGFLQLVCVLKICGAVQIECGMQQWLDETVGLYAIEGVVGPGFRTLRVGQEVILIRMEGEKVQRRLSEISGA
jgi:hypothetical protein